MSTVSTFVALMASFNPVLTVPTAANMAVLARGALLSTGPRTVTSCLLAAWPWVEKRWSSYANVLRRARFDPHALARILFTMILRLLPRSAPIVLAVDETLVRRYGPRVVGVGMHRDAVRSSHGCRIATPGHKWIVLSVMIRLPYVEQALALPILSVLYSTRKHARHNRAKRLYRRHRTVGELALLVVRMLVRWAPQRRFIVVGDGSYATHMLAWALRPESPHKALRRVSLVSRFRMDAATYARPRPHQGRGRPRLKGDKLPSPQQVAADSDTQWDRALLAWYGGKEKMVSLCSGEGLWYKAATGAKWVRWVLVRDPEGRRRDEVFFTTDPQLRAADIVEIFVQRWSLETTMQQARARLGLETLRNWSALAVRRSVPLLLGLYSLVVLWFALHVRRPRRYCQQTPWYRKRSITFSDMVAAVREDILRELISEGSAPGTCEHLFCARCRARIVSLPRLKRRAA
ncbi:MAG: transposase [Phycisphaerae bacterium]|nr:transposase [Phycisphaerae bacterium]